MASLRAAWAGPCGGGALSSSSGKRRIVNTRTPARATGGNAVSATAAETLPDLSILTLDELQRTLAARRLPTEGEFEELEARLSGFLAHPSAFPDADCRAAPSVQVVGGRLFGGLHPLRRHIQLLLEVLQGDEVELGHPDYEFLCSLLRMHPRYAQKVARPPVLRFRVRTVEQQDQPPYRFFEFQDGRGEWDDFSYRKCIGFAPDHNATITLRDAMRWEVRAQQEAYRAASVAYTKRGQPYWSCDACGWRVYEGHKLRLEYSEPSFNQLIKDFTAAAGRPPPPVDGKVPGTNRGCFTDQEWAGAWRRYHRTHARGMQLMCMRCIKERAAAAAAAEAAEAEAVGPSAVPAVGSAWP